MWPGRGHGLEAERIRPEFRRTTRETERMSETCSVELTVRLPRAVAEEIEVVQERDPEVLSRILLYGLTRRVIFEHLSRSEGHEEYAGDGLES